VLEASLFFESYRNSFQYFLLFFFPLFSSEEIIPSKFRRNQSANNGEPESGSRILNYVRASPCVRGLKCEACVGPLDIGCGII
jgi:hypothetical protein